jgi:hypothetical protein
MSSVDEQPAYPMGNRIHQFKLSNSTTLDTHRLTMEALRNFVSSTAALSELVLGSTYGGDCVIASVLGFCFIYKRTFLSLIPSMAQLHHYHQSED